MARHIPVQEVTFADGSTHYLTTVYDLMLAQYGVKRRAGDELAAQDENDASSFFTPAWQ